MKLLRLGNSQDIRGVVDQRDSIAGVEETVFERLTGEPVETVVKRIWPAEELDEIVTRWMEKEDPDAVFLCYTTFWVAFPSVPLRIQRRFGSVGMRLAKAGTTVAGNDRLAYNPVFRSSQGGPEHDRRRLPLRAIGSRTVG